MSANTPKQNAQSPQINWQLLEELRFTGIAVSRMIPLSPTQRDLANNIRAWMQTQMRTHIATSADVMLVGMVMSVNDLVNKLFEYHSKEV